MNSLLLRITVSLLAGLGASCQSHQRGREMPLDIEVRRVFWSRTSAYESKVSRLLLSQGEAWDHLLSKRSHKPLTNVYVVDDWYVFNISSRERPSLTGVYVHGMTGAIEDRVATYDRLVYPGQPKNLRYESIRRIADPDPARVYRAPSRAYDSHTSNFSLGLEDAKTQLQNHVSKPLLHRGAVDQWYFFSDPTARPGDLTGYYVHGMLGTVQYRTARDEGSHEGGKESRLVPFESARTLAEPWLPRVYWRGTRAYRNQMATFWTSEKEAREALDEIGASPSHLCAIVDHAYVFNLTGDHSLTGYYVGDFGAIAYRVARHDSFQYPRQPRNLQFESTHHLDMNRPTEER